MSCIIAQFCSSDCAGSLLHHNQYILYKDVMNSIEIISKKKNPT